MSKVGIIVGREYLQAVRKKSFLVMTILGPILLAALMIAPTLITIYGTEQTTIAVLDETGIFSNLNSSNDKDIEFVYVKDDLNSLKQDLTDKKYSAILYIPYNSTMFGGMIYSSSSLQTGVISNALSAMKHNLSNEILIHDFNIDKDSLDRYIESQTNLITLGHTHINKDGQEEAKDSFARSIQFFVGIFAGLLIYMFIFMYGSMVLRGVLEEKSNRIVEIMVSSVKPIELMVGKIVGVALIGLTQLLVWIVFTGVIVLIFMLAMSSSITPEMMMDTAALSSLGSGLSINNEMIQAIYSINFPLIAGMFLFYFMGGYFLYGTLYAAVGSAVDNDVDTNQFLLPLNALLFLAIILSFFIANNPDGQVAFWMSIIPFTSPISMMMRIPAGSEVVQMWEILLSASLLILTCMASAWVAAKIYRTGILMYGKKTSYKELWKWLRYKN